MWFFSYLTGRSQAVADRSRSCSDWLSTTMGVPQGSVLGPLLFSLYINDIAAILKHTSHMLFADDLQIFSSCSPSALADEIININIDVCSIARYASENGLKLNLSKSKVIILGSGAFVNRIDLSHLPNVKVDDVPLPFVNEVKNLGVFFMSNLSWRRHVLSLSKSVHFTLFRLKFNKAALSPELRATLIKTLIFPILDYCCLVYVDLTDELNTVLQRLLNYCIRFIFDLRRDDHISPYRKRLGWLTVEARRLYFMGVLTFNILKGNAPPYLIELFPLARPVGRPSRQVSPETFLIPLHRTTSFRKSFVLSAMYFWHSLPAPVTSSTSLAVFKKNLLAHLLALDNEPVAIP